MTYCPFSLLLVGGLCLHDKSLEVGLHLLDLVRLLLNFVLVFCLKSFQSLDFFIDESDTLANSLLALEERLLGHNRANHLEAVSVFVKQIELIHDHLIFALLLCHFLLVDDALAVLYTYGQNNPMLGTFSQPKWHLRA